LVLEWEVLLGASLVQQLALELEASLVQQLALGLEGRMAEASLEMDLAVLMV
jgi:hypothetical protein